MNSSSSDSCFSPKGIGNNESITFDQVQSLLDGSMLGSPLPYLFLPLAESFIGALVSTYETPIQFRQAMYHGNVNYNVAAMYHPSALDIWGKKDMQICINDFASEPEKMLHEQVAIAYTFAYNAILAAPKCKDAIVNIMDNVLQLPMSNVLNSNEPDLGTPWGLAKARVDEIHDYAKTDGWNADGSLTHKHNKMPYSDFKLGEYMGYEKKRNMELVSKEDCEMAWKWEPLLESNGAGYFTRQEHVTPFVGFTGRLYGLTTEEYESFMVPPPEYNYCEEADFVLEQTRDMAGDELKKMQIEAFDSKFTSLLPMQITWSIMNGLSSFDFWYYDMALVTAMYDATMLVWREKVIHNAVRPTTVVHSLLEDDTTETYAGPLQGANQVAGFDWQPYIRTMPHAEYPSGSSCICTAYAETMQILTGQDDTSVPVSLAKKAGSSFVEPEVTPSSDLNLSYNKWSEIQHICGQSRLYGGMHFSKAIPAGEELCTGLAEMVVKRANLLKEGNSNGALVDMNNTDIIVKGVKRYNLFNVEKESKQSMSSGSIAGIVVAVIAAIIVFVLLKMKHKKQSRSEQKKVDIVDTNASVENSLPPTKKEKNGIIGNTNHTVNETFHSNHVDEESFNDNPKDAEC